MLREIEVLTLKIALSLLHGVEKVVNRKALDETGKTPHDVIWTDDILTVRHYLPLEAGAIFIGDDYVQTSQTRHRVPLVFVPPLLAPGFAFDLCARRSLVRYFLAMGYDVFLIDFGQPQKRHCHLTLEHYICNWLPDSLAAIRRVAGEPELSLFGYCMGGIFILLYQSLMEDPAIRNLITVASPIDAHAMGIYGKLFKLLGLPAHHLTRLFGVSLRDIHPRYLHIPGKLGTALFLASNPTGLLKSRLDLARNLWNRNHVIAQESLGLWINNLLDYPGATMQEIIVQMAWGNLLARHGRLLVGSRVADLLRITTPLLAVAGESDEIVSVAAAQKVMDVVAGTDKTFCTVPGGHVGMIIGNQAHRHLWDICATWLAQRSD